jgi:hypothetical protein
MFTSLNILHITLACTSSPSSMPMILRFGLLTELLSSCIFLSKLLSCVTSNYNSYISLFIGSFVLLWCLLKSSLSSFICFCVFLCALFLVSWNFFSASYTFWFYISSIFSMNFSVISSKISSLRIFTWVSLDP